jgi:predicted HicB family RNase H-like nuclease
MFRGEFVGLNGGADFYASDADGLKREGAISLKVFIEACQEDGVDPFKSYSGKFVLRIPPDTYR